jgi:RNA polymerase sigma factor (sigma-70 family)
MITSEQLKSVEKMVRTAIRSYRHDLRYEDAVQEALIHAWKDLQSGEYEFNHVLNRAKLWARSFLQKHYARTTGSPPLSREGVTTEDAERKRQKITSYVHEFSKLHDRKPSNSEVSKALGIPLATVAQQRINIATGAYDHAIYEGEGKNRRISSVYFQPAHLDAVIDPDSSWWAADHGFENDSIASMDFERLLSGLSAESRDVIYYHVFMGYNKRETSQHCGITQRQLDTRLTRALEEVRAYYDPSFVLPPDTCPNGHEKTEENATYTKEGHRRCRLCIKAYEDKRRAKVKADRAAARAAKPKVLKSHCKREHEIRGIRPDGKRYCKVCNYMRGKGNGSEPPQGSKIWEWDQPK